MPRKHKRLGDMLVEDGLLSPEQLDQAIRQQQGKGELLGACLVRLGLVTEDALIECLHRQLGLPLLDLNEVAVTEEALERVKEDLAKKYVALPIQVTARATLQVAMADPLNVAAIEDLRFQSGLFIQPVLAKPSAILEAIERHYHLDRAMSDVLASIVGIEEEVEVSAVGEEVEAHPLEDLIRESEGKPIVRLTNWLLQRAVEERASDIHVEPQERSLLVRFRVDGLLHEIQQLPKWTQGALVSRLKVLANLDIAERRMPQDGRLMADIRGRRVDMRISTLPASFGEKVVMRIADQARAPLNLAKVGMMPEDLARLERLIARPEGIVLVAGPTGSGKSNLLYSCLRHIQDETKNILTAEDPIEFQLPGINQVQVDEKARKTFATALRSMLRQDPDIIMVGEIRDQETAQIAFRASITGHLVLSTVHTNDSPTAVTRLVDMGLEPFMVASSLAAVTSIRLVRTLCPRCKEPYEPPAEQLARLGLTPERTRGVTLHRGRGCSHCRDTGYQGRTGIFELLEVTDPIRAAVLRGASDAAIRVAAVEAGMRTLAEDGLQRAFAGVTTLEEVARVVYLEEQRVRVCPGCRSVLLPDFEYCPSCGEFVGDHCQKCRQRLHPRWRFCAHCGAPNRQHNADAAAPRPAELPRLRRHPVPAAPEAQEPPRLKRTGS